VLNDDLSVMTAVMRAMTVVAAMVSAVMMAMMWIAPSMVMVTAGWATDTNTIIPSIRAEETRSASCIAIAAIFAHVTVAWVVAVRIRMIR